MFDTILGLPIHPLVVHGVVVLLPLMAFISVVVSVRKPWRERLAWPVAVVNLGLVGLAVVATQSGEKLEKRLGVEVSVHESWGKVVPIMASVLFAATVLLALARRNQKLGPVAVVLTLVAAAAAVFWTIRTGHTGAEAVWGTVGADKS